MRIQEMKSGFLHLKKKVENERHQNYFETPLVEDEFIDWETGLGQPLSSDCELDEPLWSVISFDQTEAGGLNYAQATALMKELDSHAVAGLCIVTDEAASRIRP